MLVLTREKDGRVFIDTLSGRIEVIVVETRGKSVRLGFIAPPSVSISRDDVKDATHKERTSRQ